MFLSKKRNEDRISVLHDDVLLHILSFLEMKEVLKTSVLSKRWELIWTLPTKLTFQHSGKEEDIYNSASWVQRILLFNQNTSIEKLHISFHPPEGLGYSDCFNSDIDGWALFASAKEVTDLTLDLNGIPSYILPRSVYSNKVLINLSIYSCILVPKLGLNWTSLKSLSMTEVSLNDDTIANILSGSPMLEFMKMDYCDGYNHLHINSKSLRQLVIKDFYCRIDIDECVLEISAVNLLYLNITNSCYNLLRFRMLNISSLLKAEIDFKLRGTVKDSETFYKEQYVYLIELIERLHHVPKLKLGPHVIQILSLLLVEEKTLSSPLNCLTCLEVDTFIDDQVAAGIISVLKCAPNLEKLILTRPDFDEWTISDLQKTVKEYWESGRMIEKFTLPHLKTIKWHGFKKFEDGGQFTLTLLQVILESVGLLECKFSNA